MAAHRYWRIQLSANASNAFSFAEIQFRDVPGTPRLFSGGTASATQTYSTQTVSLAIDNDLTTFWSGVDNTSGQSWTYDYGSGNSLDVQEVMLTAIGVYDPTYGFHQTPSAFTLQYSDDNSTWTTVQAWTNVWFAPNQTDVFTVGDTSLPKHLIASYQPAGDRNDFTGYVGLRVIPPAAIRITALGVRKATGNTTDRNVYLVDSSNTVLASVAVPMSAGMVGSFQYVAITPVDLVGGATYYVAAQQTASGENWANGGSATYTSVGDSSYAVYSVAGSPGSFSGFAGQIYVGVDMLVAPIPVSATAVSVSKMLQYDVLGLPAGAVDAAKLLQYDVLAPPAGADISKVVQYVVLNSSAGPSYDTGQMFFG